MMKARFVCKRAQRDIQPVVGFLATRVKGPKEQDYRKLVRLMEYLKTTPKDEQSNEWWFGASFAVHQDYKSHTCTVHTLGKGAISLISTK